MKERVLLDTNVYISALIFGGKPKLVLDLASAGAFQLLISRPLEGELVRVLREKFGRSSCDIDEIAARLWSTAEWIEPRHRLALCPDEPDNRVLECALEGGASYIVTGDRHLLDLPPIAGVRIVTADGFLGLLGLRP